MYGQQEQSGKLEYKKVRIFDEEESFNVQQKLLNSMGYKWSHIDDVNEATAVQKLEFPCDLYIAGAMTKVIYIDGHISEESKESFDTILVSELLRED